MTLLKISQGITSNPCLFERFGEGSSLPSAGLGCGGNPILAHSHRDISQGKPLAQKLCFLFSLETRISNVFRKNVTYKQTALAICASPWSQGKPGEMGYLASLGSLAVGHPFVASLWMD